MIREEQNGSLTVLDPSGKAVITVGVFDPGYNTWMAILDRQIAANRENLQTRANYEKVIDGLQRSVDAGRIHPDAPAKPLMKVVGDDGSESWVPFVPALNDLIAAPPADPSKGQIKVETPDLLAQTHAMVRALYRDKFPSA